MSFVIKQYQEILDAINSCAEKADRPNKVTLLAVSKTFPAENIAELYSIGHRCFGESKAVELAQKASVLPPDIQWHFIGHLQSNKVKTVLEHASVIHSIDSLKLLQRVSRIANELNRNPQILLEVNVSGESSKTGFAPEQLTEAVELAKSLPNVQLTGLMTMAPEIASEDELTNIFSTLHRLATQMDLKELSMGMSGDYPQAINNGATIVRVGSAIFGTRSYL